MKKKRDHLYTCCDGGDNDHGGNDDDGGSAVFCHGTRKRNGPEGGVGTIYIEKY